VEGVFPITPVKSFGDASAATPCGLFQAKAADLVLIPCRPSYIDLKAISTSVDLVEIAKRSALFVLTCVRPGDKSLPDQAEQALGIYGIPGCPCVFRSARPRASAHGRADRK
jgi:hypothetical protein